MATINKTYTTSLQSGVSLQTTTLRIKHVETAAYVFQEAFAYPDPVEVNTVVPESGEFEITLICKFSFDGKSSVQAVRVIENFE